MTKEEKQLLLIDLCARLPYGFEAHIIGDGFYDEREPYDTNLSIPNHRLVIDLYTDNGLTVLPYLRPMSSMTEEELREFAELKFKNDDIWEIDEFPEMKFGFKGFINIQCRNRNSGDTWIYQVTTRTPLETYWGIDWLNAHHFDYRGLIPMGLAFEAKEGMYKSKEL